MPTMAENTGRIFGSNVFVNRDSGALCRVRKVDDTFAYLDILSGSGLNALSSAYSMPVREYDSRFAEVWRPARPADFVGMEDDGYRPPADTGDWPD